MTAFPSRWLIAAFPLSITLVFCTSTGGSGSTTTSASSASSASSTAGAGGAGGHGSGGGGNDVTFAGGTGGDPDPYKPIPLVDGGVPPDAAVPPPVVACGADVGTDAGEMCALPPSYCADYNRLVFYQNPECVDGTCHYEAWIKKCGIGQSCTNGGCEGNLTAG